MNAAQEAYIDKTVRPLLEGLAEKALEDMPDDVRRYLLDALERKRKPEGDDCAPGVANLRQQNIRLFQDFESLQSYCNELERMIIQIAPEEEQIYEETPGGAPGVADSIVEEGEEEDDDDDDWCDELPDMMRSNFMDVLRPRSSVSAEAYGAWNQKKEFVALVYHKTDEEKAKLRDILAKSFMFAALNASDLDTVIDAVRSQKHAKSVEVIQQGDDGNCLYIVGSGSLGCYRSNILQEDGTPKCLKVVKAGEVFGELAVLYNCPRAATVIALEETQLWQLDRDTFNHIVRDASAKVREENEAFVKKVKLFNVLDVYDKCRMAECLKEVEFPAGAYIIRQGEAGDRMFFIKEGQLEATKNTDGGGEETVYSYTPGEFFGEIAIMRNMPRAANVVARSECKVMALLAEDFNRLFGSLADRMKENLAKYKGLQK